MRANPAAIVAHSGGNWENICLGFLINYSLYIYIFSNYCFLVENTFACKTWSLFLLPGKVPRSSFLMVVHCSHSLGESVDLCHAAARCVRGAGEKMDAMFGPGTSRARQDTGTVTLASWPMWQLAVTVCCNDLCSSALGSLKLFLGGGSEHRGEGWWLWVRHRRGTDASWNCGRGTSLSTALRQLTLQLHYCHIGGVHSGQTLARHPLWLPAVCSVSQWQQLNSYYLRHFPDFNVETSDSNLCLHTKRVWMCLHNSWPLLK